MESERASISEAGPPCDSGFAPTEAPRNDAETSLRLPHPAQQKHPLLAEHVPAPPGRTEPQRSSVEIERHRPLHLDVDLVAQLNEILDGAEMNVRRVVPG